MDIDRKFKITAICRAHGYTYTEEDGVFFKVDDAAFNRAVLDAYKRECFKLGANPRQMEAVELLIDRVERHKALHPATVKVPDVDPGEEYEYVCAPNKS